MEAKLIIGLAWTINAWFVLAIAGYVVGAVIACVWWFPYGRLDLVGLFARA